MIFHTLVLISAILIGVKLIMSKISQFAEAQKAYNARMDIAFEAMRTALEGMRADMQTMSDKIEQLQNSDGEISIEDQATLDELTITKGAMVEKIEAFALAMQALDAVRPQVPNVE